jgi:Beta-lactamase enzyme family/ORF 12 gene product N-terminal
MNSTRSARTTGRLRATATTAIAVAAACAMAAAGCDSPAPKPAASPTPAGSTAGFPDTAVGRQARWLLGAVARAPIPAAAIRAHFDATFRTQVPASRLNSVVAAVRSLRLDSITKSTPGMLVFVVTANGGSRLAVSMVTDARGLISGLLLRPASTTTPAVPASWPGVDRMIRSVAPQVHFLVAAVHGNTCRPVHAIGAATPAPLGSAFKLYVLDALARAVAAGTVSWDQPLIVTSQVKSLPSGVLQDDPDGTRVSVRQVATGMISISDNTAANMLIALLGRSAVEAATRATGMADPALDVPFLTTRELFVLKLDGWPTLARRYLALGPAGRQAMLSGTVDRVPLSALPAAPWTEPRDIGSLEWFASPTDICHAFASLATLARQPKLAPLAGILARNAGGMTLDPSQWRPVWFKGGSEPGVLTLNYLATTRTGQAYVASVLAADPAAPLAQDSAVLTLISAVKGALQLAARRA